MLKRGSLLALFFIGVLFSGCRSDKGAAPARLFDAAALLKQDSSIKPVVVIGGGVAGLTAANYLLQANIPCVILEGKKPGGALAQSDAVRNWPGVLEAPGATITRSLKNQVIQNGAQIIAGSLTAIDLKQPPFTLTYQTEDGRTKILQALSCIVAMGAEPNYLGVPGENGKDGYWGRGVSNCAVCDGALFKNKTVAVVGGGDSAMLEAAYLAGLAKKVYVLVRRDVLRANDKRKVEVVKALPNVTFMYKAAVQAVQGNAKVVTHLDVVNTQSKAVSKLDVDGLFLAIGATPNTKLLASQVACDAAGYITLKDRQASSVAGVFAAGDICDPHTKQAVTSSAMGCTAALQAKEFLENQGYIPGGTATAAVVEKKRSTPTPQETAHDEWVPEIISLTHAKQQLEATPEKLLVVDVYGSFCIPCQKMAPLVEELAKYYDYQVSFAKLNVANRSVNVDEFAQMVSTAQIMQVPTFLFIKRGKVLFRHAGMLSKEAFTQAIEKMK